MIDRHVLGSSVAGGPSGPLRSIPAAVVLALVGVMASPAAAQPEADSASGEANLTRLLDWMFQQRSVSPGAVELYRVIRPLAQGESERLPFSGGGEGQILIVDGFCDDACTDMDIVMYGEDGEEVGADRMDDDVPIVEVPAGTYEVEVSMATCSAPECLYGLLIVGADERAPLAAENQEGVVAEFLDLMSRDRAAEGGVEIQRFIGSLAAGASERFSVEGGEEGELISLDGACDYGCTDIDLVVYDEDGEEVGADRLDDDVPIVELPAGSYEAEVSMIVCETPECFYGVVVHSGVSAGSAEGVSGEEGLTGLLDWLAGQHASSRGGVELYRAIRPLGPRESERLPFAGGEEGQVLIVDGFCDDGCTDMDIVVYGEDGEEVGADRMDDDVPIVEVPAGSYDIEVTMAACGAPECLYGVLVVAADERTGGDVGEGAELVSSQLDMAGMLFGSEGLGEAERWQGTLAEGDVATIELPERAPGVRAAVVAACDEHCATLDMVLRDAAGDEVAADRAADSAPMVEAPEGAATADVLMTSCAQAACTYGVTLFRSDVAVSEPGAGGPGPSGYGDMVSTFLDTMSRDRGREGAVELQRATGSLAQGASERFAVEGGEPGGTLFLDGACDMGCTDIDLVVYGEDGEEAGADRLDDDVPIVAVPSGRYEVEISMLECTEEECGYGVLVTADTGEPGASEGHAMDPEASAMLVAGLLDIIVAERTATGVVEIHRTDGLLAPEGIGRFHVEGGEPGQVLVLDGVCDASCDDLDLIVYDENGDEVGADRLDDDVPVVEVPAGGYDVEVRMHQCTAPECLYGVVVFTGEEGASELPASGAGQEVAFHMLLDMLRNLGGGEGLVELQRTSGELSAGASERLDVPEGGRSNRLFVAGVCDEGCTDLDLALYDAEGVALSADRLDDDHPVVDVPSGAASIGVEMAACDEGPCTYFLILMAETGE